MDCESVAKKIPGNAAGMFWRSSAAHLEKSLQRTATDDWSSHRERREALSKTSITLAPPRSKQYQLRPTKSDRMDGQNYSAQKLITPGTTSPQVNAVTEVSVLLKFLGNENASISASCCMARPRVELSTRNSNRNGISANGIPSTQNKTLKIVDIPLDELPFNNKAAADKKSTTKRREGKLPAGNSTLQLQQHFWLNLAHTDSSGIGTSASESASSVNSSPRGIEKQNYCRDYRVISLDAKPRPGRLDDFVPEVERKNVENWSAIKPQQGRDHQCPKRNKGPTNAKLSDEEVSALERDEDGRLIIPSKEWRKFIAEQRPNTSVKLNSRLQLIHREEEWYKPKVIISNKGYQSSGNNGQCINSMKKEASSEPLPKMFHTIAIYGENTRTAAGIKMG